MSGTQPSAQAPALHTANITNNPLSTAAGILNASAMFLQGQGGLPTSTQGWIGFGLQGLMSIFMVLSRG